MLKRLLDLLIILPFYGKGLFSYFSTNSSNKANSNQTINQTVKQCKC